MATYVLIKSMAAATNTGGGSASVSSSYTFTTTVNVSKVVASGGAEAYTDSYSSFYKKDVSVSMSLMIGGTWTAIVSASDAETGPDSATCSVSTTLSGVALYKNVSAMRYAANASAASDHDQSCRTHLDIYLAYKTPTLGYGGVV